MHASVLLPPAAGTVEAIQLHAQQLEEDRRRMELLKAAIEHTHGKVQVPALTVEAHGPRPTATSSTSRRP